MERDSKGDFKKDECYCCRRLDMKKILENSSLFHCSEDRELYKQKEDEKLAGKCMLCQVQVDKNSPQVKEVKVRAIDSKEQNFEEEKMHRICLECFKTNKKALKTKDCHFFCRLCKREEYLQVQKMDKDCCIF